MVLHSDNCEDEFPGGDPKSNQMAEMPVDYSSCNGDCMFTIYWLGFQNAGWQAYVNCVPLKGSGSANQTKSGTSDAGSLPEGQATGASPTETGGSTDEKQSTDANLPAKDSATKTEAPSAETKDAGTPTMDSPSTETETKCTAPSRRLRKKVTTSIA
ncbi:Hypothetical protein PHPALM_1338 [Phytophthora palmivora]|uniref:Uncharacterized protein n=1 Tax=Phytophthora palmivora TaxID=4796 RepID=A0A2P4YSK8_9STRA|nr:Hypothetical protein PHPALM_1338 [Phytophthora palmivora]